MAKNKSPKSQQSNSAQNAHITKITAKPSAPAKTAQVSAQSAKPTKVEQRKAQKAEGKHKHDKSHDDVEKPLRQVFILVRPFVAIGRYLRDSWRELRLVRWPSRSNAWKMTFAVLIYCAIFIIFITLIDSLFTFIFNILLGQQ